nr:hypothetical protein [Tanacetum cinerariifolium]
MIDNMVWVLVNLPPNCKIVGSKWIFKENTDMDGNVHIYKDRLVAKSYTRTYLVDYEETFSPVADIRAIRILISIAAFYDYEIWQMDVKNAFLNGYLDEDIYMVQPKGFIDPNHPKKVCKLQRSIYDLKQASISWNKRFDGEIKSLQSVKDYLGKCFAMKDLGQVAFILGIKIYRDRSKRLIGLGQNSYMDKILKRYKIDNSKHGYILMQERLDLNKIQGASTPAETGKALSKVLLQSLLHKLNYIAASEAEMEAIWIRKFISRLGIIPTINEPIKMFCNNSAALLIANEPRVQMGARHYHRSNLLKVHTDDNLVDSFTKALSNRKLTQHARSMGLHPANQIEDFSKSNEEFSSIDDDSFFIDNIDYVEASPPDSELVSSEVMDIVISETKSSSTSLNSLLEETNTFDNSLPEFEICCFDVEEICSGSTTTHPAISLPEYEVFYDDHVKEISSGSPTTHSDSSLYASFIFDLSINPFPPANRSDSYEFTNELIPFISPLEYDCFLFKVEPNSRDFTKDVVEDISPTKEPQVLSTLPTHPTLQLNMKFHPSSESLFTYVVWIFLPFL